MKILVNGIGNIGQTLLGILSEYKTLLNIDKIYALKNTSINDWNKVEIEILKEKDIIICTKNKDKFQDLNAIINEVDYIFDCNANSFGMKNKEWYNTLTKLKGSSAQGSEKGFGIPFMTSINNDIIINEKYVQIVSCNTHALSAITSTILDNDFSNLVESDFVIVRRSEDLGNSQRLVGANVLSRHLNNKIGTHHAIDVKDLFATKNMNFSIQSSDITTPSQLMHSVRFNIQFKETPQILEIQKRFHSNKYISTTAKFDSNIVFELGRRYSLLGRLYSHAIINSNNILFDKENNRIKGWAFIPQEGNTILSTIHAFLLQIGEKNEKEIMRKLKKEMIREEW